MVDLELPAGQRVAVLVKTGDREVTRTGQRCGPAYEADVYELLGQILGRESPYLGRLELSGRAGLVLRWSDGALPLGKAPYPEGILTAAAWLGSFHRRAEQLVGATPGLTDYADGPLGGWLSRMADAVQVQRPEERELVGTVTSMAAELGSLLAFEPTVVHGDLYPANVLWVDRGVLPVDWEWAGVGAGELDVAALTDGWPDDVTSASLVAYDRERRPAGSRDGSSRRVASARIFLAARRLGGGGRPLRASTLDHYLGQMRRAVEELRMSAAGLVAERAET